MTAPTTMPPNAIIIDVETFGKIEVKTAIIEDKFISTVNNAIIGTYSLLTNKFQYLFPTEDAARMAARNYIYDARRTNSEKMGNVTLYPDNAGNNGWGQEYGDDESYAKD